MLLICYLYLIYVLFTYYVLLFVIYYESQPKAWAEYRYKRSEAKLVWGVWGGEALIWARFGKVRPEPAWGELQKTRPHFPRFWRLKEKLHFGHFWLFSDVFLTFFIGCQKPKHCNLQCFWAFGMEKVLLATCWKLRKYHCFCKVPATKHCKYRGFWYQEQKTP
jgi:hypothetical protein